LRLNTSEQNTEGNLDMDYWFL